MSTNLLNNYINALTTKINTKNIPKKINLIIDGGAFAGGCIVGNLLVLKQLEKQGHIKIEKISGCSIGAILGLLFIIDKLDCVPYYFKELLINFRKNIKLTHIKIFIQDIVKDINIEDLNNRLYITYNNIESFKHIVCHKYTSKTQLIKILLKTSYIPLLIDGKIRYNKKYCDGFSPYIFNKESIPSLFISMLTTSQFKYTVYTKNDRDIWPRLFNGVNDMIKFFNTKNSNFCSYIDDWTIIDFIKFRIREFIILIIIFLINIYINIKKTKYFNYLQDNGLINRLINILIAFSKNILSYMIL